MESVDAVVVGAGPNGLAAAIELARAGKSVTLFEAAGQIGGGSRSAELTLPGFIHDTCSAIHPLAAASPFFKDLKLEELGLEWIQPTSPLAHPFDDGTAAVLDRSLDETGRSLGPDADAYRALMSPLLARFDRVIPLLLGPLFAGRLTVPPPNVIPPLLHFARTGIRSAAGLGTSKFQERWARAMFAGMAAHAMLPLTAPLTAGFGLLIGVLGHGVGWPLPKGGSQRIADALSARLVSLGGEIAVDRRINSMTDLPPARAYLFDVTPRQLKAIAGDRFSALYRRRLKRFRYGPGVFKVDWALNGPVPWKAGECSDAGTVHLGGTVEEMVASEQEVFSGRHPERPYTLVAQQSLFDPSRAPAGKQTLWAYCHVPNGSTEDMTGRIEGQIERFAPGFRDLIIGRAVMTPADVEAHNANNIGGDISGGTIDLRQLLVRPSGRWVPYTTPADNIYICSSSTPPGGGVHGMCGYHAARAALHRSF
jgi:phytoene dehydrogenase-like protein